QLAYDSGIEAYLTKPVRQAELIDALARILLCEAPSAPAPLVVAPGRRARVLIVEDNLVNQEVARAMLTELGCSIRVACDGREALATLRDDVFDLVFMDCQMPEMDGFEAVRRFRSAAAHGYATAPDVPIVALTANALAGDADRCLQAGFSDYLAKPVRREELDAALLRWVREPAAVAPPQEVMPAPPADATEAQDEAGSSIDMTAIDLIRDMERRGATRLLDRLVSTYIATAARLVAQAAYALKAGDLAALQHATHTLKSSSANLGAIELARRFGTLERHARSGALDAAREEWGCAQTEYERAVKVLRDIAAADEAVVSN
ncbi:MAG TPA: response regulator, partial [Burkholderiaceae bacterium]|nr:response regulator [Burkholderiaceae bacterium]